MTKLNPVIFREYDIRGLVEVDLDRRRMGILGKAFGTFLSSKGIGKIVVGRDNRTTSMEYKDGLVDGIRSCGVSVVDVGEVTTPCILFAEKLTGVGAGIAVTASHNPPAYNGLKLVMGGRDVGGETIKEIGRIAEDLPEWRQGAHLGKYEAIDVFDKYIGALAAGLKLKKKFKVAVDTGNGTVGRFVLSYLRKLGCEVIPINCESDPTFPNHPPDTVKPEYYPQLIGAVLKNKADIGLMFDGDGDRIAAVDEKGSIVWADMLLLLYARQILRKRPEAKVVVEIKCSQAVLDDIKNHGGVPILWKTGRTNIEDKMFAEGAVLGGEMSGHMFFADQPNGQMWLSEALYAAGRLLQMMDFEGKPLSELLTGIPKYFTSQEYRVPFTGKNEDDKFALMERIVADFKKEWGAKVLDIDGARVVLEHGWALVRVSKGEPLFSMRFEGKTEEDLKEIMAGFRERLKSYPEIRAEF